jgi:SAM-dependent methyltransferase
MRSFVDELALAGPEHLDPDYVARYDSKARFDPAADLLELRERGLGPESTLVELGCGTGTFALAAAQRAGRVAAVDISPAMVDSLRARAGGAPNMEVVQAGFLSYRHKGEPADCVYSRNALHHLPDFWKAIALERIAEMLVPQGILRLRDLVFAFPLAEAEEALAAWLDEAAVEDPAEGWTRPELEEHVASEHSTFSWLLEPMLEQAGFTIERADYGGLRTYADYLCIRT